MQDPSFVTRFLAAYKKNVEAENALKLKEGLRKTRKQSLTPTVFTGPRTFIIESSRESRDQSEIYRSQFP